MTDEILSFMFQKILGMMLQITDTLVIHKTHKSQGLLNILSLHSLFHTYLAEIY